MCRKRSAAGSCTGRSLGSSRNLPARRRASSPPARPCRDAEASRAGSVSPPRRAGRCLPDDAGWPDEANETGPNARSSRPLRCISTRFSPPSLPERKRWNTNSMCLAVSSSWRTRSCRSPGPSEPTSRSSFSHTTQRAVPGPVVRTKEPWRDCREVPRSICRAPRPYRDPRTAQDVVSSLRVTTTMRRHCENDAVLSPRPNRPRSVAARSSRGLLLPGRIASRSSGSVHPCAVIDNADHGSFPMRLGEQFDPPGFGGQRIVDHVGHRGPAASSLGRAGSPRGRRPAEGRLLPRKDCPSVMPSPWQSRPGVARSAGHAGACPGPRDRDTTEDAR